MGTRVLFEMTLKEDQEAPEGKVRVLLAEDHAVVREAIASTLGQEVGFEVVGQAGSLSARASFLREEVLCSWGWTAGQAGGHSPGGGEAQLREGCQPSCGIDQGRGKTIVGWGEWTRRWYRSGVWDSCVG
jgi:hypothetical protein